MLHTKNEGGVSGLTSDEVKKQAAAAAAAKATEVLKAGGTHAQATEQARAAALAVLEQQKQNQEEQQRLQKQWLQQHQKHKPRGMMGKFLTSKSATSKISDSELRAFRKDFEDLKSSLPDLMKKAVDEKIKSAPSDDVQKIDLKTSETDYIVSNESNSTTSISMDDYSSLLESKSWGSSSTDQSSLSPILYACVDPPNAAAASSLLRVLWKDFLDKVDESYWGGVAAAAPHIDAAKAEAGRQIDSGKDAAAASWKEFVDNVDAYYSSRCAEADQLWEEFKDEFVVYYSKGEDKESPFAQDISAATATAAASWKEFKDKMNAYYFPTTKEKLYLRSKMNMRHLKKLRKVQLAKQEGLKKDEKEEKGEADQEGLKKAASLATTIVASGNAPAVSHEEENVVDNEDVNTLVAESTVDDASMSDGAGRSLTFAPAVSPEEEEEAVDNKDVHPVVTESRNDTPTVDDDNNEDDEKEEEEDDTPVNKAVANEPASSPAVAATERSSSLTQKQQQKKKSYRSSIPTKAMMKLFSSKKKNGSSSSTQAVE